MLPSWPLDLVTPKPIVDTLIYPTRGGTTQGEVYRPSRAGRHAGVVVCLGVVPFGVDHPQVPRLGAALARSGVAALLYWSPAMRDHRLDPADVADIASAYERLINRPSIDAARTGLLGACVGGAFALMAAVLKLWLSGAPTQAVVFSRGLVMSTIFVLLARRRRVPLAGSRPGKLLLRGLLGYGAISCYFASVSRLPVGDAVLLQYSHPVFVAMLAPVVLTTMSAAVNCASKSSHLATAPPCFSASATARS